MSEKSNTSVKCILIGESGVGKTSLVVSYTKDDYPAQHEPTAFDTYVGEQVSRCYLLNAVWQIVFFHVVCSLISVAPFDSMDCCGFYVWKFVITSRIDIQFVFYFRSFILWEFLRVSICLLFLVGKI